MCNTWKMIKIDPRNSFMTIFFPYDEPNSRWRPVAILKTHICGAQFIFGVKQCMRHGNIECDPKKLVYGPRNLFMTIYLCICHYNCH